MLVRTLLTGSHLMKASDSWCWVSEGQTVWVEYCTKPVWPRWMDGWSSVLCFTSPPT